MNIDNQFQVRLQLKNIIDSASSELVNAVAGFSIACVENPVSKENKSTRVAASELAKIFMIELTSMEVQNANT